jgi:hypothetical protein
MKSFFNFDLRAAREEKVSNKSKSVLGELALALDSAASTACEFHAEVEFIIVQAFWGESDLSADSWDIDSDIVALNVVSGLLQKILFASLFVDWSVSVAADFDIVCDLVVVLLCNAVQEVHHLKLHTRESVVFVAHRAHLCNEPIDWCSLPEGGLGGIRVNEPSGNCYHNNT